MGWRRWKEGELLKKKKRFKPMAGLDPESSEKIYIFEKIRAI